MSLSHRLSDRFFSRRNCHVIRVLELPTKVPNVFISQLVSDLFGTHSTPHVLVSFLHPAIRQPFFSRDSEMLLEFPLHGSRCHPAENRQNARLVSGLHREVVEKRQKADQNRRLRHILNTSEKVRFFQRIGKIFFGVECGSRNRTELEDQKIKSTPHPTLSPIEAETVITMVAMAQRRFCPVTAPRCPA